MSHCDFVSREEMLLFSFCSTCDKLFHNGSLRRVHEKLVHNGAVQPCLVTEEQLKARFSDSPIVRNRSCDTCAKLFSSRSSCVNHQRRCRMRQPVIKSSQAVHQNGDGEPKQKCTTCLIYIYE